MAANPVLMREFAVAIVNGIFANPDGGNLIGVHRAGIAQGETQKKLLSDRVWEYAKYLADQEPPPGP